MKTTRHDSFAAYVLPSVLAFALSGLYTIVDGFFIGQSLGDLGLAAITLAYPAAALLQAVGTGIGLAGAIRCTILQARGEEQTPRTCFSGTVLLLLATSAAFAAVLLGLLGPVLTVLGAQDEARPLAAEYIRVIACGTAFQILATGLVPFIRNLGGSAFAMVAMGTGFVTNIALDYLFVWEFHWGMAGGAWATVIGQAATMLLAIGYLVRRRVGFVPPKAGEVLPLWGALLKVAAAPVGLTFSPNITLMVMNHFLLRYGGALAIAVYGCIDYVLSTIYMLLQGVGDGSQPLISRTYGAGDFGELRRTGARAYRAAFGITAVCIVALFLARSVIGVLFGIYVCHAPSIWALVVMSVALGVSYAGTANIMLNGLGVVLSPEDNPGYLPGLNSGAFNLGAGLSYAVLYAMQNAFGAAGDATNGYVGAMIGGVVLLALAFAASLLIPKQGEQQ